MKIFTQCSELPILTRAPACLIVAFKLLLAAAGPSIENDEKARIILKQGIEAKDPDVRVQAILAASMIGRQERLLDPLVQLLHGKDVKVRITTVRTLGDLKILAVASRSKRFSNRRCSRSGVRRCQGSLRDG